MVATLVMGARFLIEIACLVGIGYWGFQTGSNTISFVGKWKFYHRYSPLAIIYRNRILLSIFNL